MTKATAPVQKAVKVQPTDPIAALAEYLAREAARGQSVRATMRAMNDKQRRTLNRNGANRRIAAALRYLEGGAR